MSANPRETGLDPNHAAFMVMEPNRDIWMRQLECIHTAFEEIERQSFRSIWFRKAWREAEGNIERFLRSKHLHAVPTRTAGWGMLLRAWLVEWQTSRFQTSGFPPLAISAICAVVRPMTPHVLDVLRTSDERLYTDISLAIWTAINARCKFEDRLFYHPGGGGMHQSFVSVCISMMDQYLRIWPVQTDPLLRSIKEDIAPWWERWCDLHE